ncbi:MAG: hypothetical protein Q9222_003070 [Ikaeria aurantiellina]
MPPPPNTHAILRDPALENYLTAFAFHIRGLTPWGLAIFLQHNFRDGPIKSGPDVCMYMRRLHLQGPEASNGSYQRWAALRTLLMGSRNIEELSVMISKLDNWFRKLPAKYAEVLIFDGHLRTIFQQMRHWGGDLTEPNADTRCLTRARGIMFSNKLREVEQAQNYRQRISEIRDGLGVARHEFIAFMSLVPKRVTAFQLALAVYLLWYPGPDKRVTDYNIYDDIRILREDNDRFFMRLEAHGITHFQGLDAEKAKFCPELYECACREVDLVLDRTSIYHTEYSWAADMHAKDRVRHRYLDPTDYVGNMTIIQQMAHSDLNPFDRRHQRCIEQASYLRPIAQQKVMTQRLIESTNCSYCKRTHGVASCPGRNWVG